MVESGGCARTLGVMIVTLTIVLLSYFSAPIPDDRESTEDAYPFVLDGEAVEYSFIETLNCQYVIAGNIEFLDDSVIDRENIVIMVQQLGTYDDRPPAIAIFGYDTEFGENGWSQLLVGNYSIQVWIHDLTSDTALSERILVDNLDCRDNRTLALVNFRQVLPLN